MKRMLIATLSVAALAACGGRESAERQQAVQDSIAAAQRTADSIAQARAAAGGTEEVRAMIARRVHFDFDRSRIRPGEDTQVLEQKVAILRANPNVRLAITGHCDERGTRQYNQALGMRRAEAAKRFLTSRGIAADRITVSSRGEDEPLDTARNRQAWARNRRTEFAITAGGDRLVRPTAP